MEMIRMGKNEIIKQLAERIYGNVTESEIKQCTDFCDSNMSKEPFEGHPFFILL